MDRIKSLANTNLRVFSLFTILILLCCTPLLFSLMRKLYAKDLDELITSRSNEFVSRYLPDFSQTDVKVWNKYNEDVQIIPYDSMLILNKPIQEPFFNKAEGHQVDYRILYTKIKIRNHPYILVSRIPMIEDHDLIMILITQYGSLFLILIVSLTLLQKLISKKLWKPFYSTLEKIEHFSLEKGAIPKFDNTGACEFVMLNGILTDLIKENVSIYKKQKEFIENAAHELQTPLAVFQSQLDILLQQSDLSKSITDKIQSLYSQSARMARLNKNLLLLTRIDNQEFDKTEEIDFVQTLYGQLQYLRELAESEGLKFKVNIEKPLKIKGNRILTESLITNLIVNAIRYNNENGIIKIQINDRIFEVSNSGDSTPLDSNRIFRRFNNISKEKRGNGLGLSIVYQICQFHKWNIKYVYNNDLHNFIVTFY